MPPSPLNDSWSPRSLTGSYQPSPSQRLLLANLPTHAGRTITSGDMDETSKRSVLTVLAALDDWVEQHKQVTQMLLNEAAAERRGQPDDDTERPPSETGS